MLHCKEQFFPDNHASRSGGRFGLHIPVAIGRIHLGRPQADLMSQSLSSSLLIGDMTPCLDLYSFGPMNPWLIRVDLPVRQTGMISLPMARLVPVRVLPVRQLFWPQRFQISRYGLRAWSWEDKKPTLRTLPSDLCGAQSVPYYRILP